MAHGVMPVIDKAVAPAIEALGYEFVGYEIVAQGRGTLLRIYIDAPGGIKLQDCEIVSRQVGAVLDVEDPFSSKYLLEVSSPGLERPLFTLEHYKKFVNEKIRIRLRLAHKGQRNFNGLLHAVEDDAISLRLENGELLTVSFREIDKGNLQADIKLKEVGNHEPRRNKHRKTKKSS